MNTYRAGTLVFCDFAFGGKPKGKAIEVIEPGKGNISRNGIIKVQLTQSAGPYKKDEILFLPASQAVPRKQEVKRERGQYFRRINTQYVWEK